MANSDFILYHYTPTLVGAIIFAVLFSATSLHHSIQLIRYRAWFMVPVLIGGICKPLSSPTSFCEHH